MNRFIFDEIELPRFEKMLERIFGQETEIAILDAEGNRVTWAGIKASSHLSACIADGVKDHAPDRYEISPDAWYEVRNGGLLFCNALGEGLYGSIGTMIIWLTGDSHSHDPLITGGIVGDIADILKQQYLLIQEINNSAMELAGRYEELQLAYIDTGHSENNEEQLGDITSLLCKCINHLNIDLAIFAHFGRGTLSYKGELPGAKVDIFTICEKIVSASDSWFQNGNRPLIINDLAEPLRFSNGDVLPYKVIAMPIYDYQSRVCGVLAMINRPEHRDFSNSDKNLIGTVAVKAAQILQSGHDMITGLINRALFKGQLELSATNAKKSGVKAALIGIGLDQFKVLNDVHGIVAGDFVLKKISQLIRETIPENSTLARIGGDTFGALLKNVSGQEGEAVACRLRERIEHNHFEWNDRTIRLTASIGVSEIDGTTDNPARIFNTVEIALTAAKEMGRNRVEFYQPKNTNLIRRHDQMVWVEHIKNALAEDRFELYCQRIQPLTDSEVHYELLLRMLDENGEIVPPGLFLGSAEQYGLMSAVDTWVISHAIDILDEDQWQIGDQPISWGINLSGLSMGTPQVLNYLMDRMQHCKTPTDRLYFEITETSAIHHFDAAVRFIVKSKELGCRFALDDFGSGLSSFAYLKNLPIDYLKIDGAFIKNILNCKTDETMIMAMHQIARVMGLKTIAEFVEDQSTLEKLRDIGIDYAQGYHIMKPAPLRDELTRIMGLTRSVLADDGYGVEVKKAMGKNY